MLAISKPKSTNPDYAKPVVVYADKDYKGTHQELDVGKYEFSRLTVGGNGLNSIKVPDGKRIILHDSKDFEGTRLIITEDTPQVEAAFKDKTAALVVELSVRVFTAKDYGGEGMSVGTGQYNAADLAMGVATIASAKVAPGMALTLFEKPGFEGKRITITEDTPSWEAAFGTAAGSMILGLNRVEVPELMYAFGSTVGLKAVKFEMFLGVAADGSVDAGSQTIGEDQKLVLEASGKTRHPTFMCYGDIISFKTAGGRYITVDSAGNLSATAGEPGEGARFEVQPCGDTENEIAVGGKDMIALKACANDLLLVGSWVGNARASEKYFRSRISWQMVLNV